MRYTDIDRRLETIAAKQHGVFSRKQAFHAGASDRFVNRRLQTNDWLRPVQGIYVLSRSPATWERQCKIAELSIDGAALAGRAAAVIHGFPGFKAGPIDLAAPANARWIHPFATVHRFAGAKFTTVAGMRVTTFAQTAFDLIALGVDPLLVERAIDDGLVGRRIGLRHFEERLSFYAGSRREGLPKIRALVLERAEEGWAPAESDLEVLLHAALHQVPSGPRIVRQATFPWRSALPGRVDVLLPDQRIIIEADGRRWHTRVQDFDRDRWRDNEAVAHDYRVMRFTWVHLHDMLEHSVLLIEDAVTTNPRNERASA